jgi:hypothetical protein
MILPKQGECTGSDSCEVDHAETFTNDGGSSGHYAVEGYTLIPRYT